MTGFEGVRRNAERLAQRLGSFIELALFAQRMREVIQRRSKIRMGIAQAAPIDRERLAEQRL
jgi:hypothetical protein